MSNHPDRYRKTLIAAAAESDPASTNQLVTYWLKHKNRFVSFVKAPRGLPARTVRFLAANEHDHVPLPNLPLENALDRRRAILNASVQVFDTDRTDLFAEDYQEVV